MSRSITIAPAGDRPGREIKAFPFKMDQVGEAGEFTGYASTFGEVDQGGDIVDRGAFRKTLRESRGRLPVLDHHDPTRQVGWNLEAREDERGLFVRGLLDLNVRAARERHSLMRMAQAVGARTGLSIGFRAVKEEPDSRNPLVRRLKEVQLLEYSIVTFPMNPQAGVTSLKARQDLMRQFLRNEMGLDPVRSARAIDNLKSLLSPEPGSHSGGSGADLLFDSHESRERLMASLRTLLTTLKTA